MDAYMDACAIPHNHNYGGTWEILYNGEVRCIFHDYDEAQYTANSLREKLWLDSDDPALLVRENPS